MDAIRSFVSDHPTISGHVENVYKLLYEVSNAILELYARTMYTTPTYTQQQFIKGL